MRFDNLLLSEKNNAQCTEVVIGSKSLHKFILYIGQLLLAQTQEAGCGPSCLLACAALAQPDSFLSPGIYLETCDWSELP